MTQTIAMPVDYKQAARDALVVLSYHLKNSPVEEIERQLAGFLESRFPNAVRHVPAAYVKVGDS